MTTSNSSNAALRLSVLEDRFAVCSLEPENKIPDWALKSDFSSVTRTLDELSIVCPEQNVPVEVKREENWRALRIEGPLDFSLVGVLASLLQPLAEAEISIFTISTYDTDYVLMHEDKLEDAISTLRMTGHEIQNTSVTLPVTIEDQTFLWEMLYEAVYWSSEETDPKPPPEELLANPGLRRYLEDWGRENDYAVVAIDPSDGSRIGATWYRLFLASDPGYGFVDDVTPEIALAISPNRRGAGVGGTLLRALMNAAHTNGFESVSLGVQKSNHDAIKLYEKSGFVRLRDDGRAWIMKADLTANQTTNDAQ